MNKNYFYRKIKSNKGFTLTELIIVIVIIGILAAVMIPTITHYVERARLSNDKSDARNMTMLLNLEAYDLDKDYFEPSYVIAFLEMNGYSIKTRSKGNAFCYNYQKNTIEVVSDESLGLSAEEPPITHPVLDNPINRVRAFDDYLYIDQKDSPAAVAINTLANLLDLALADPFSVDEAKEYLGVSTAVLTLYDRVVLKMQSLFDTVTADFDTVFEEFNPTSTIYVNENGYYTNGDTTTKTNLIITSGTTKILDVPTDLIDDIKTISSSIFIPNSVISDEIADNSFLVHLENVSEIIVTNKSVVDKIPSSLNEKVSTSSKAVSPKNQVEKLMIYYTVLVSTTTVLYTRVNSLDSPTILAKGDGNGKFTVDFTSVNILPGSSIDIKHYYDNKNGYYAYDVRIFDINGVLYARGILKYLFDSL